MDIIYIKIQQVKIKYADLALQIVKFVIKNLGQIYLNVINVDLDFNIIGICIIRFNKIKQIILLLQHQLIQQVREIEFC